MLEECWQLVAEHMRHMSHFMTNCHKRGGLTVISTMTFQNMYRWDNKARKKEGEHRVNGFLSAIDDMRGSAWELLFKKKKKKL